MPGLVYNDTTNRWVWISGDIPYHGTQTILFRPGMNNNMTNPPMCDVDWFTVSSHHW